MAPVADLPGIKAPAQIDGPRNGLKVFRVYAMAMAAAPVIDVIKVHAVRDLPAAGQIDHPVG